jgi:hypothetical protein
LAPINLQIVLHVLLEHILQLQAPQRHKYVLLARIPTTAACLFALNAVLHHTQHRQGQTPVTYAQYVNQVLSSRQPKHSLLATNAQLVHIQTYQAHSNATTVSAVLLQIHLQAQLVNHARQCSTALQHIPNASIAYQDHYAAIQANTW